MQHGDQHLMIELRDQGYVELNGLHDAPEAAQLLDNFYRQQGCQAWSRLRYVTHAVLKWLERCINLGSGNLLKSALIRS